MMDNQRRAVRRQNVTGQTVDGYGLLNSVGTQKPIGPIFEVAGDDYHFFAGASAHEEVLLIAQLEERIVISRIKIRSLVCAEAS